MKKFPIPTTPEPQPAGQGRIVRGLVGPGPKRIVAADKPDPRFQPTIAKWRGKDDPAA